MSVNDLTANLYLNLLEKEVSDTSLIITRPNDWICLSSIGVWKNYLNISFPDQIGIAVDHCHETLSIVGCAGKVDAEWFNGKVSMTLVEDLPEGDVRISCNVCVLSTISDKL
jgi:hypothetical protein